MKRRGTKGTSRDVSWECTPVDNLPTGGRGKSVTRYRNLLDCEPSPRRSCRDRSMLIDLGMQGTPYKIDRAKGYHEKMGVLVNFGFPNLQWEESATWHAGRLGRNSWKGKGQAYRIMLQCVLPAVKKVLERLSSPIFGNCVREFCKENVNNNQRRHWPRPSWTTRHEAKGQLTLPESSAASGVYSDNKVSLLSPYVRIPPGTPPIFPSALWTSVYQEHGRPFLVLYRLTVVPCRIPGITVAMRFEHPALHLSTLFCSLEPELFTTIQVLPFQLCHPKASDSLNSGEIDMTVRFGDTRGQVDVVGTTVAATTEEELSIVQGLHSVNTARVSDG